MFAEKPFKPLTQFCREYDLPKTTVYRDCKRLGIDTSNGLDDEAIARLKLEYGIEDKTENKPEPTAIAPQVAQVTVESGNHRIVLRSPELPQNYSLEALRTSDEVSIEDPLAVAEQFLQVADQITDAMQQDLAAREARLRQTQQAKEAIAQKAQHLHLEKRLYQERANLLNSALSQETAALQTALGAVQDLGKPAAGDSGASP
ncbi:hypothetical protein HNI00_21925 [Thermoleptolyngbya oregonensis NK1-22]|uniref:Uncharacterized protein n=1 Tax=Thermoleptolyngbya oregonensis NK1-22 TaxID=2547457 RepID=A0AA97BRH8_9CYAN|nr:hypothetical protein [Thermoleptolyngbya oregonensis]WOB45493.1 hypothetical protein HNI00_21925 [Thermoleptolyngbya oregonensis NK1-22]